jgi:hypothetical protein
MLALALLVAATGVPPELTAYYRDHNFVCAFSTVAERRLAARGAPADDRMRRVAAALARMERRVLDLDPGIVVAAPGGPGGAGRGAADTAAVLRADLVRLTAFEMDEAAGEAWVHLEVLRLAPPAQVLFIQRFTELAPGEEQPDVDDLLAAAGQPLVRSEEIHRWVLTDGGWRRERATRHLSGLTIVR